MAHLHCRRWTRVQTQIWMDSKPDGYIVQCRTCSHCTDSESDPYFLFLCTTGIWVRIRTQVRQCKWAITGTPSLFVKLPLVTSRHIWHSLCCLGYWHSCLQILLHHPPNCKNSTIMKSGNPLTVRFIYTERNRMRKRIFKLYSLWTHLEAMSLFLSF